MNKKSVVILFLAIGLFAHTAAQVVLGDKVPNFKAIDENNRNWVLKKELRKADYLVIYFYPAAFTGGCTKQACSYRDQKADLDAEGAQVVGVSGDNPETLGLFAMEHQLNFSLLSDESGAIAAIFGVPVGEGKTINREINGKTFSLNRGATIQRWTFILNRDGILIYKDAEVEAASDSGKVAEFISSLK